MVKKCDLVMKGGITSGIVYPPAVLELQKTYTFESIGGTSAGAIAAAGTAAAEYNREQGGFDRLQDVRKWLSQDDHLRNLFQATADTQILLDILNAATDRKDDPAELNQLPFFLRIVQRLAPAIPSTALLTASRLIRKWNGSNKQFQDGGRTGIGGGILVATFLAIISALTVMGIAAIFGGARNLWLLPASFLFFALLYSLVIGWLGMWIGRIVTTLFAVSEQITQKMPDNYFGICTGHSAQPDGTNLTDWLSDVIDNMAGLPPQSSPLTFGKLSEKDINLKMVTSNLSHGQPYVLPEKLKNFIYRKSDMQQLFPDYVVKHLLAQAPCEDQDYPVPPRILPKDYYFLPDQEQIPVVFGARLSLSFPLLLSAVPLYTVSTATYNAWREGKFPTQDPNFHLDPELHLQKNWFSDGGICSNFPIQFFDDWLPTHPTFGINLTKMSAATSTIEPDSSRRSTAALAQAIGQSVYLPPAEDRPDPEWTDINQLFPFLSAIFGTSQNYRDTMQANLPSYRERVAQIRLDDNQGGLNLAMPSPIIEQVVEKGKEAGQILSNPETFNFDHHWWVRFLVLMGQLEENIEGMESVLTNAPDVAARLKLVTADGSGYPYCHNEPWCNEALLRIKDLETVMCAWRQAAERWGKPSFFHADPPMPDPVLRVTPPI
ncbi:MAG TPA: patatin-like phospholipase family protein [Ktedonobacteraceae bacterium]|nr:patatin-like phospholipase family protein [Ktedonobacteraceae bacterium]